MERDGSFCMDVRSRWRYLISVCIYIYIYICMQMTPVAINVDLFARVCVMDSVDLAIKKGCPHRSLLAIGFNYGLNVMKSL